MTSVERLKFLADKGDECWLGLSNVEAIKDVLAELEKYKMLHLKSVASRVCNDLKTSEKHKEDLEMLYEGCKAELEKKDKVIDKMAEKLVEAHGWFYSEFDNYSKEDWKEYFYKKVE